MVKLGGTDRQDLSSGWREAGEGKESEKGASSAEPSGRPVSLTEFAARPSQRKGAWWDAEEGGQLG